MTAPSFRLSLVVLCAALTCLAACEKPTAAAPPPPPKVTVARAIVRDVTQWDEYTGRLEAVESVDVKAQVSGFIDSVDFTEGSIVKKGDLLLTIDSRIFKAQLDTAKANVEEAKAKVELANAGMQLAQADLKRADTMSKNGVIGEEELDTRRAAVAQAQATVAQNQASVMAAQADVEAAQLNVNWCNVTAPISGRISSRFVTAGNMLTGGPGQTTTITSIKSVDPIYCYVDADEASVLKYQKLARERKRVSAADQPIPCYMELANETTFPHTGTIDFVDNHVDPATGTRRARGSFPNPDGTLLPGYFARFRVEGQSYAHAMLVIDDAVGLDQDRKFLIIVKPDNTIERRTVVTGPLVGELRVILSGLQPDESVMVNGAMTLAFLQPGGHVAPESVPMPETRFPATPDTAPAMPAASMPAATSPEGTK